MFEIANKRRFNENKFDVRLGVAGLVLLVSLLTVAVVRDTQWDQRCKALGGVSTGYTCVKGEVVAVR